MAVAAMVTDTEENFCQTGKLSHRDTKQKLHEGETHLKEKAAIIMRHRDKCMLHRSAKFKSLGGYF